MISTPRLPDSLSESAWHLTAIGTRLAARGHDVELLTRRESRDQPAQEYTGAMRVRRYGDPRVHRHASGSLTEIVDAWRDVRRGCDVVLGEHCTPTSGALAGRLDAPLVYRFHAPAFLEARDPDRDSRAGGPLAAITPALAAARAGTLRALERRVLEAAHRVLVPSRFSREVILETFPQALGKLEVIPGGVDQDRFRPAADRGAVRGRLGVGSDERLLLAVRRLAPRMGLEELIDALALARARLGRVKLVIVGSGPLEGDLRDRAARRGVDDVVRFAGLVRSDTRALWYQAADLLVLPTQADEGLGVVAPEALASGTPVVGTRAGATPELLEGLDPRLLADGLSSDAIAAAMVRFFEEVDAAGVRALCRTYSERRHAWPAVIDRYEEVLEEVRRAAPRRRVALVGPRLDSHGGVGAMVRLIASSPLTRRWELRPVATYRDGTKSQKALQAGAGLARLAWLCAARRVDLVHLHASWDASFTRKAVAYAICRVTGRPVVLHVHGGGMERELARTGPAGTARRQVISWVLGGAQSVVALTPGWADGLRPLAGNRPITVVPNAPDLPTVPAPNGGAPERMILFLGHLYHDKGVFELVEAFARLRTTRPDLRMVMAGEGREREAILRAAAAAGLPPEAIELPGWVGPEDKAALLAEAHVFVLPSWIEGLPLALLEAMTAGLPIVATDVGGIPEAARDGQEALIVPPRDTDALERTMARVLDDPALAVQLGRAARRRAEETYSAAAFADRVETIYREALTR